MKIHYEISNKCHITYSQRQTILENLYNLVYPKISITSHFIKYIVILLKYENKKSIFEYIMLRIK